MNKRRNAIAVKLSDTHVYCFWNSIIFQNWSYNSKLSGQFKKSICKRINKDSSVGRVCFLKLLYRYQNSFKIITLLYKEQGTVKFHLPSHFQYNTEHRIQTWCALKRNWALCHDKYDIAHAAKHPGSPARKVSPNVVRSDNLRNVTM